MSTTQSAKPVHGATKPKNVPFDMVTTSPVPCDFAVGDLVVYTNDYGLTFDKVVRGFVADGGRFGRFVYIDTDSWWAPVEPESLQLRGQAVRS
jgi:hypothetical protein